MLIVGIALSLLLHLFFFATLRFGVPSGDGGPAPAGPDRPVEPEGMQLVRIVPVPTDEVPQAETPEPLREDAAPRVVREPSATTTTPVPAVPEARGAAPSVSSRISPRLGDARLFADPGPAMPAPTDPEALARARFLARIDAYNDSSAAASAAAAAALDWTVEDGSGGKWGVSPGKLHLGGLTLPLPVGFAPPPGRREELAERNRRFGEISGQRARETGRATFEERAKAIRAREQAKRDSTRAGGTSR